MAIPRPIPREEPVTNATFPFRKFLVNMDLFLPILERNTTEILFNALPFICWIRFQFRHLDHVLREPETALQIVVIHASFHSVNERSCRDLQGTHRVEVSAFLAL